MERGETRTAIDAADAAFATWRRCSHAECAARLWTWHDLMLAHEDDLALILTLEQGNPLAEVLAEIRYGASFVRWFAEEARRIGGGTIPSPIPHRRIVVPKGPVGAVAIANGTPYGLAAYFFTRDLRRSWRVGEALDFGMVGLNTGSVSTEVAPFGGVKQSGLGCEGAQCGIDEYLETKAFHIGGVG